MIDESSSLRAALLLALLGHAALLGLVRIPASVTPTDTTRALIVHLTTIAEQATAPASVSKDAAASMASSAASAGASAQRVIEAREVVPAAQPDTESAGQPHTAHVVETAAPEATTATESRARHHEHTTDAPAASHEPTTEPREAPDRIAAREIESAALDPSRAATPTDRASRLDAQVRATYEDALAAWLRRHKHYPMNLRRRGVQGSGALRLEVDRSGNVRVARMETPIGDRRLDDLTLDMVHRAEPFPHMPSELTGDSFECVIDVRYRIDD